MSSLNNTVLYRVKQNTKKTEENRNVGLNGWLIYFLTEVKDRHVKDSAYQFGLSTLRARIRFMKYFLHLSYCLGFKKWHVKGEDHVQMLQKKR